MVNMNGGKALMKALEKEGVKEVFGLPEVQTFQCMMSFTKVIYVIY
jgi:thiamine pyrophosphate-dependent acetolactate synthase large subunit-like protein